MLLLSKTCIDIHQTPLTAFRFISLENTSIVLYPLVSSFITSVDFTLSQSHLFEWNHISNIRQLYECCRDCRAPGDSKTYSKRLSPRMSVDTENTIDSSGTRGVEGIKWSTKLISPEVSKKRFELTLNLSTIRFNAPLIYVFSQFEETWRETPLPNAWNGDHRLRGRPEAIAPCPTRQLEVRDLRPTMNMRHRQNRSLTLFCKLWWNLGIFLF